MKVGKPWRVNSQTTKISVDDEFDELVVGKWLHIEQMNNQVWWMRIGDNTFNITVDKNQEAILFHVESNSTIRSSKEYRE